MNELQVHTLGMVLSTVAYLPALRLSYLFGDRIATAIISLLFVFSSLYHGYCYATDSVYDTVRFILNTLDWGVALPGWCIMVYLIWRRIEQLRDQVVYTVSSLGYGGFFLYGNSDSHVYHMTHSATHVLVGIVMFLVVATWNNWRFTWSEYFTI
jgi:hypothetical protein